MLIDEQNILPEDTEVWEYILTNIRKGSMIPVISNSLRLGHLFREELRQSKGKAGSQKSNNNIFTIDKILTEKWAKEIQYPLQDKHNLARVAQYWQVENPNQYRSAKEQYLDSLKKFFLDEVEMTLSHPDGKHQDVPLVKEEVENLRRKVNFYNFSELVVDQLSYPRFSQGIEDPLRLLAKLDLPFFITTSHFDFLERVIRSESGGKKEPRIQVCFCKPNFNARSEHALDHDLTPDIKNPVVYHIYGLEDYPESLILSEDDYLNFLISMFENKDMLHPLIPSKLRKALATSPLLLLGFQLHDWDFRVLFRFLLKFRQPGAKPGLIIQLNPGKKGTEPKDRSVEFLNNYFGKEAFNLFWEDADSFIQKLYRTWSSNR